jgi:hypothetical protein
VNISKKRLKALLGRQLDHLSENPDRDFEDLHAVLTGPSRPSVKLRVADTLLGNHGIETILVGGWKPIAEYSNTGDTYALTILRDLSTGEFQITSYGDFVERVERRSDR